MIGVGAGCLRGEETGFFGVFRVEGQRKWTGLLQFSNFYDDSKPKAQITVETWFARNEEGARSMS